MSSDFEFKYCIRYWEYRGEWDKIFVLLLRSLEFTEDWYFKDNIMR